MTGVDGAFFYSQALKNASLDSLYDDDGVILTAYPGGDIPFAIRIELLPGRVYVLEYLFKDSDSSPPSFRLPPFPETSPELGLQRARQPSRAKVTTL